jgi:adenosylhomocysteine nucleosidase
MEKRPIVVMAAMEVEADFLASKLENVKETEVNKYKFYEGTVNGYPVVVCRCLVMTINAAVATYIAIEKYNPIAIISQGTAGGSGENIHKGDIVIGEKCINIISSKTPYKKEGEGSNSLEWELCNFISGEEDRLVYQYADENLIELAKQVEYKDGNIHTGIIGSGDIWSSEIDRIKMLNQKYGVLCEEMEGIAIYILANNFNIPVIGIRVISDNEILREEYDRNLGRKSQEFAYSLIQKMIEKY